MTRPRPAIRLRGWLVLLPLLAPACSYSIVRHGEINQSAATKIEQGIEDIRGLKFRTPVPMEVKSPEELRQYLEAELARQYTPEQVRGLQRVYERLGLLAPGVDLGEALVKLYTAQIAGFYDPAAGTLFLVPSGLPPVGWTVSMMQFAMQRDLVNEMLLAHELTHALQDQNFGTLKAADDPSNDDRSLAIHAVVEGDATLAGFAYLFGGLPENSVLDLVDRLGAVPAELEKTLPDTPPVLRDSLVFQYSAGAKFVALAYLRGGWTAVNALLQYPPTSTEQVLWPDKYFGQRKAPTLVHIGGLDDYRKANDWKLIEENTMGALTVRILIEAFLDPERALQVASGWDGDRFIAYEKGDALHIIWMSAWDGDAGAHEFFAAEREILARKFPESSAHAEGERIIATGPEPYVLERRGDKVLVVLGVPAGEAAQRVAGVWAKTTLAPEPAQTNLDRTVGGQAAKNASPTPLTLPSEDSLSR
jgi:hypothetical protein